VSQQAGKMPVGCSNLQTHNFLPLGSGKLVELQRWLRNELHQQVKVGSPQLQQTATVNTDMAGPPTGSFLHP